MLAKVNGKEENTDYWQYNYRHYRWKEEIILEVKGKGKEENTDYWLFNYRQHRWKEEIILEVKGKGKEENHRLLTV